MSGSSPLSRIIVCVNSGVWSHLGITGTGKVSWSFQCWVPHSIIVSTSTANFCAWSPNADRHLTASWSELRVWKIMVARLLMYDWAFFMTSSFSFWNLRTPSARRLACPVGRSCSGTGWASLVHVVTAKLLVYGVCVYLAPCPHHTCYSSTSYSYSCCASGFYSTGESSTSSYFCFAPDQALTDDPPLSSSDHGPDPDSILPDRVPHWGHCRGLAAVAFWPSFTVPHLAGRTDVLPSFGRDVADVGSPGL